MRVWLEGAWEVGLWAPPPESQLAPRLEVVPETRPGVVPAPQVGVVLAFPEQERQTVRGQARCPAGQRVQRPWGGELLQ